MNSRRFWLLAFISAITLNAQVPIKSSSLDELIREAISVSPQIKMLEKKLNAVSSRIEINTNLPDPALKLGLVNMPLNSFAFDQEPMTGKIIGINQAIPYPGGLSAAAKMKSVDTSIVRQEIEELKNKIRKSVSELYYDLQFFREEIRIANESKELLQKISDVVKRKYESGTSSLQNVIQVEVMITRLDDKIESMKGKETASLNELNALLLRNESKEVITNEINEISAGLFPSIEMMTKAKQYRPYLKGIDLYRKQAELKKEVADFSYYPNFNIGLQYTQRDRAALTGKERNDLLSVVIGISLPIGWGGEKSEKVNEAVQMEQFYNDQYNSSLQKIRQSLAFVLAKLTELTNREELIKSSLLPQTEQAYKAALADYQVGKIDFINVLSAEDDILKVKTSLAKIRTDYFKQIAELEYLTGTETENKKMKNTMENYDEK